MKALGGVQDVQGQLLHEFFIRPGARSGLVIHVIRSKQNF